MRVRSRGYLGEYCADAHDVGCLTRYIGAGEKVRRPPSAKKLQHLAFPCCQEHGLCSSAPSTSSTATRRVRTAFVVTPYLGITRGSAVMRGEYIAKLLSDGRETAHECGTVAPHAPDGAWYDVYVHVKFPCMRILQWPGAHVWDMVDIAAGTDNATALQRTRLASKRFAARLLVTTADKQRLCRTHEQCSVIDHPYNLRCQPRRQPRKQPLSLVVGMVGFSKPDSKITEHVRASNFTLLTERMFSGQKSLDSAPHSALSRACAFYSSIDVAVAWTPDRATPTCCYSKPAERFTNPVMLDIPTIGAATYGSFRDVDPSGSFLCDNERCLFQMLEQLRQHRGTWPGTLLPQWEQLRQRVRQHVDVDVIRQNYDAALKEAATRTCATAGIGVVGGGVAGQVLGGSMATGGSASG